MRVTDEMVEMLAKWLHDEVEWPEYNYPERSWPEHEGDTGQRGDGWLKIVPPDVCEQFRDIARRLPIEAALAVEGTEAEPVAWRYKYTDPGSGKPVWRDRGGLWNGQQPEESQPLYTTPPAGIREALAAENERLRAALAMSDRPCVYCSLPADEWSKCPEGFPGCSRGDDAMGCPELGAGLEVVTLKGEIKRAAEVIESFISETVDYMTRNNLGDPEKQHNVRWGRKVLTALRGEPKP